MTRAVIRIEIDQSKCLGSGSCVHAAPRVFDQNEETGMAELRELDPPLEWLADVMNAAHDCPAGAIIVTVGDGYDRTTKER